MNNWISSCLFSILFLGVATIGCMEDIDNDPKKLIGRWKMSKVIDKGKVVTRPDRWDYPNEVEIEFLTDGEVMGTLPAEEFTGNYKLPSPDSISISCYKSSKAGINEWGSYLFYNVKSVTTFSLVKSRLSLEHNALYLNYLDGQLIFDRIN